MITRLPTTSLPPRNGGKVTIVAEGRVNPGEVSGDGRSVVFGGFTPQVGESVFRWRDGEVEKLNQDGYSSFEARCNHDASVVVFNRYSLADGLDNKGNWNIGRWQDGKVDVIAESDEHEMTPDIDDSGNVIVFEKENKALRKAAIMRWESGETKAVTDFEAIDLFSEVSGNGQRITWRRNIDEVWLQDQNGVNKPIATLGHKAAGIMLDQSGEKLLYSAEDADGDRDLYILDLSTSQHTVVSNLKGVEEYDANFSGDGKTVVYTAIDFRKKDPSQAAQSVTIPSRLDAEPLSEKLLGADTNVYVWREGKTEQLTWNDGGLNTKATVSDDGKSISWFWIDREDTNNRKVLLWQKDEA